MNVLESKLTKQIQSGIIKAMERYKLTGEPKYLNIINAYNGQLTWLHSGECKYLSDGLDQLDSVLNEMTGGVK